MNVPFGRYSALAALFAHVALVGCNKGDDEIIIPKTKIPKRLTNYSVEPGQYYFNPQTQALLTPARIDFKARFASSTAYSAEELAHGNQVNKLYGYSDCGKEHTVESARFGWMMVDGKVDDMKLPADQRKISGGKMAIVPFVHLHSVMTFDAKNPMAVVDLDQWYTYRIQSFDDHYQFTIEAGAAPLRNRDGNVNPNGSIALSVPRGCSGNSFAKYLLMPYFGGQSPAPRSMGIDIEVL